VQVTELEGQSLQRATT